MAGTPSAARLAWCFGAAQRPNPPLTESTPMPPAKTTGRIAIDYRFVPAPHELILDPHVSPPAFRLWCVLAYMDWTREPPSVPILQSYMQQEGGEPPTRRSIYRWFGELESRGWLEWIRTPGKAGINDRVTVKTHGQAVTSESQLQQPVILMSQPATLGSQVVTLGSQVDYFHALSEPPEKTTQKIQTHETHDDDGRTLAFLESEAIGAAQEFAHLPYESMRRDYQNRRDEGQDKAVIVKAWRRKPPTKDYCYERPRSVPSNNQHDSGRERTRPAVPAGLKLASSASWKKPESTD